MFTVTMPRSNGDRSIYDTTNDDPSRKPSAFCPSQMKNAQLVVEDQTNPYDTVNSWYKVSLLIDSIIFSRIFSYTFINRREILTILYPLQTYFDITFTRPSWAEFHNFTLSCTVTFSTSVFNCYKNRLIKYPHTVRQP